MRIIIEGTRAKYKSLEPKVRATLSAAFVFLKKKATLDVYLVSNGEIQSLNRRYRGKNKATNILSFEWGKFPFLVGDADLPAGRQARQDVKKENLGEIFLAPDYVRSHKESISRLLVHGLLHLFGYTHSRIRDRIMMEALEDRIEAHLKNSQNS